MSDLELKNLFINTLETIKTSKELSYTTISRLTGIKYDRINNIKRGSSTLQIDDLQKLLVYFTEYQHLFVNIEGLNLNLMEKKYTPKDQEDLISTLQEQLLLYKETKTAQRETIDVLKAEISRLNKELELREKLLAEQLSKK